MGRITEDMIRRRAEHNEGMLSTLEEVALHQQHIERIELIGRLCPKLQILYLQNNLISKIENLHGLKELRYLNLALNNITKVQNLQRCEALEKLDLTANFVPKEGLLTLRSLAGNHALRELYLVGNPCAEWPRYREFVIGALPQLRRLDGRGVRPAERIAAAQGAAAGALAAELLAAGIDARAAAACEDDAGADADNDGGDAWPAETGVVGPDGELRRPWCPATRVLEHREAERAEREAAERKRGAGGAAAGDPFAPPPAPPRRVDFPELPDDGDEAARQCNEGRLEFTLDESDDGSALVLEVAVGRHLDTSLIRADVRPRLARLLVKGRLLQLRLPAEVRPDASTAQRSKTTGALELRMPLERAAAGAGGSGGGGGVVGGSKLASVPRLQARTAATAAAAAGLPQARVTAIVKSSSGVVLGGSGDDGGEDDVDALPDL